MVYHNEVVDNIYSKPPTHVQLKNISLFGRAFSEIIETKWNFVIIHTISDRFFFLCMLSMWQLQKYDLAYKQNIFKE